LETDGVTNKCLVRDIYWESLKDVEFAALLRGAAIGPEKRKARRLTALGLDVELIIAQGEL
jgi:hypothetical protein